jgi:hypothetical protein
MASKPISQKKWAKLVASTSPLAQPPGSISRASNLLFTTRGSLQIASGSAEIGRLPSPFTAALALAAFTKYASGSYPFYCALAAPAGGYALSNPQNFSITTDASGSNAAGFYAIAIVAQTTIGGVSVTSAPTIVTFHATHTFSTMYFQWSPQTTGTLFEIYYLASSSATVGLVIVSPTNGIYSAPYLTASYNGSFSTGTTPVAQVNTSALLELIVGSVTPPSVTVTFTPISSAPLPGTAPQPAQLLPGDPNFVFDTINTIQQTLYPSSSGGTAAAVANSSSPSNSQTTSVANGWAASPTVTGQQITVYVPVSGGNSVTPGTAGGGSANYEYSTDSGSTWTSFSSFPATQASWNLTLSFSVSAATLTDLSHLQIRIVATAAWGYGTGSVSISGSASSGIYLVTTTQTSFSPYGGIPGQTDVIPQLVQFAGLEILILGNGYAPQSCDPTEVASATLTALTNTFQAAYPAWQSDIDWITGAQVTDGAGNYYTATQGGVSQTPGPPTWATAKGAETADGSVIWTSQGPIISITAPRGAAHAVAYAGSLWLANTYPSTTSDGIDGPTCLKMSDANNPNSWNPVNTAFIGRDDGTQITGLQPFTIAALGISPTGSLCVFKEFTTYQVIGVFGSTTFEIQPAQTNLGCIAARSIQFLPGFGVVRFTHLGFAVFDGINDRLISEDIRSYLFGGVDSEADLVPVDPTYLYLSQSAQTASPPMYFCAMPLAGRNGALTRLFCYDLVMKAWAVIDLPWAITTMSTNSAGEGYPLVLCCRASDGSIQRMQSGDVNWDNGGTAQSSVNWSMRSPDIFGEGSSQRLFIEQVTIRGYGSAAMVSSILANLWLDGKNIGAQAIDTVPQAGGSLFEARVAIFLNGYRAHLDLNGNGGGAAGVIDALDWSVVPKSSLARRIIS